MSAEQLRRKAMKNAEDKREQELQYQAKIEQMSNIVESSIRRNVESRV